MECVVSYPDLPWAGEVGRRAEDERARHLTSKACFSVLEYSRRFNLSCFLDLRQFLLLLELRTTGSYFNLTVSDHSGNQKCFGGYDPCRRRESVLLCDMQYKTRFGGVKCDFLSHHIRSYSSVCVRRGTIGGIPYSGSETECWEQLLA